MRAGPGSGARARAAAPSSAAERRRLTSAWPGRASRRPESESESRTPRQGGISLRLRPRPRPAGQAVTECSSGTDSDSEGRTRTRTVTRSDRPVTPARPARRRWTRVTELDRNGRGLVVPFRRAESAPACSSSRRPGPLPAAQGRDRAARASSVDWHPRRPGTPTCPPSPGHLRRRLRTPHAAARARIRTSVSCCIFFHLFRPKTASKDGTSSTCLEIFSKT